MFTNQVLIDRLIDKIVFGSKGATFGIRCKGFYAASNRLSQRPAVSGAVLGGDEIIMPQVIFRPLGELNAVGIPV